MNQQSAFDREHIEESAVIKPPGLLEQFNLPPEVIAFIRKNQRTIWIITGCIAFAVVAAALFNQYRDHREDKAAAALSVAMQEEDTKKAEALTRVVDEFGSTSSGMWGRVELAHIAAKEGDLQKAIQEFNGVRNEISAKNPLMPLVLYALGVSYEKNKETDKAVETFKALSGFKGFEASSYEALGRLYEMQGKKAEALDMYRKSIEPAPGEEASPSATPEREIIQAKINALQD